MRNTSKIIILHSFLCFSWGTGFLINHKGLHSYRQTNTVILLLKMYSSFSYMTTYDHLGTQLTVSTFYQESMNSEKGKLMGNITILNSCQATDLIKLNLCLRSWVDKTKYLKRFNAIFRLSIFTLQFLCNNDNDGNKNLIYWAITQFSMHWHYWDLE